MFFAVLAAFLILSGSTPYTLAAESGRGVSDPEKVKDWFGFINVVAPDTKEITSSTKAGSPSFAIEQRTSSSDDSEQGKRTAASSPVGNKSYLIPAAEIPGFIFALNGFSRLVFPNQMENGKKVFRTNPSTFWDNVFHGDWDVDEDAFRVNQILHPYQGTIYHGFARSAGLNFWESFGYTFAGSLLWETAGETTPPSINDQVASGIAGSFLGEPLFRMASLLLEGRSSPGFWRELGAAAISPSTGFNRLVFGERFKTVFPSRNPAVFWQVELGANISAYSHDQGGSDEIRENEAIAGFSMDYGLPGKPGYSFNRPFDYFHFELNTVNSASSPLESIVSRGLLLGKEYEIGNSYRGIWGLYGSYEYLSPQAFRAASTAASLGTTSQWWLSRFLALQGTALAGIGYGAGTDISGDSRTDRHYGSTGQGLLSVRLILDDIASFDAAAREYYIGAFGATHPNGHESIDRLNAGFTVRIRGRHALGIRYLASSREASFPESADRHQRMETLTFVYTFLSDTRFGAVEWRGPEDF